MDAPSSRLQHSAELQIAGLARRHACHSNAGIPAQWAEFAPHNGRVPGQRGNTAFGVICATEAEGQYEYLAGVEVEDFPASHPEFTLLRLPPREYLVFEHTGHISSIGATWQAVWEGGIAAVGHEPLDGTGFERYDHRFDPRTGQGTVELWVPVKP